MAAGPMKRRAQRRGPRAPAGHRDTVFALGMRSELADTLRELAAAEGVTMTEWIRRAMRERMERIAADAAQRGDVK